MMAKTPVFILNSFNEGPVFGRLGCSIYGLMGAYTGPGAAITNAAIAFDRYRYQNIQVNIQVEWKYLIISMC